MIEQKISLDGLRYYEYGKFLAIRKWDGSRLEYRARIYDCLRQDIEQMDREIVVGQVFRNSKAVYVVGRPDVSPHFGCYEMQFNYLGSPLNSLFFYYEYTCRAKTIEELSNDLLGIKEIVLLKPNQWANPAVSYLFVKTGVLIKKKLGYFDFTGKFIADDNSASSAESV